MVFGKINDAYDSVKNGLEAQISLATADQKELLANARLALAELKEMMADLKEENRALADSIKNKSKVEFGKSGVAWIENEPYCAGCFGDRGKLIRLKRINDHLYDCPKCKAQYQYLRRDAQFTEN